MLEGNYNHLLSFVDSSLYVYNIHTYFKKGKQKENFSKYLLSLNSDNSWFVIILVCVFWYHGYGTENYHW